MFAECDVYMLDDSQGSFVKDGQRIEYHNARFMDAKEGRIFKASIPDYVSDLPEPMTPFVGRFEVRAGERFCKLYFLGKAC